MISCGKKWRHLIDEAYTSHKDYDTPPTRKPWWKF